MLWAVIMAGGSGTRFWPESRAKKPKQFLNIFGKKTLLEQTADRIRPLIPKSRWLVVTQKENVMQVASLLKISKSQIVGEPVGRNTAPCAVLAARRIAEKNPGAVLAILPSDHHINKEKKFRKILQSAARAAADTGLPVTLGIKPSFAHTGYGYLELASSPYPLPGGERGKKRFPLAPEGGEGRGEGKIFRLKRFHEKPSLAKVRKFLKTKRFLWNSGMFIWKAASLLKVAGEHLPKALRVAEKIVGAIHELPLRMQKFYPLMPNISIDYGLMEKIPGKILTVPADIGWQDLGSWQAFEGLWKKDKDGNVGAQFIAPSKGVMNHAPTVFIDCSGNIIKSGGRLIAMIGVKDHVIVDTSDVLLICPKDQTESVKKIVEELRKKKLKKYL